MGKIKLVVFLVIFLVMSVSCSRRIVKDKNTYPDFITENKDYFVTRIRSVPDIDKKSYRLKIHGLVEKSVELTLDDLRKLDLYELPLTVECIGNSPKGPLVSTAIWKGFSLYNLLLSLGLDKRATGVRYLAADTYYASHTMDQLKNNNVTGALYMNGKVIPPLHGFPIRFLNPGYHGVKQPAWVIDIEVIDKPVLDYWDDKGWDCSPPMEIDSTIFFPEEGAIAAVGETIEFGGAAFGGTRVRSVEISSDNGETWENAEIIKKIDKDNVWVFWNAKLVFTETGEHIINVRASDIKGNIQPVDDPERGDGENDQPSIRIFVIKAERDN